MWGSFRRRIAQRTRVGLGEILADQRHDGVQLRLIAVVDKANARDVAGHGDEESGAARELHGKLQQRKDE